MKSGPNAVVLAAMALILFAGLRVMGQSTPCTAKLTDLPQASELMGFRMGMTKEQVKARVRQVDFGKTDDLGVAKTTINPDFDPKIDKMTFNGVRSVSLDFLDSKLTSLWLGYDSSFKWKTVEAFVQGISASLHLPSNWQPWKVRGQQLRCADFLMTVTFIAEGPSFRILDQVAEDLVAARREAKEAEESTAVESGDAAETPILADTRSKVYYPPSCPPLRPISDEDQMIFKSVTDAEKAGYKKAKNCPEP